MKSALELALEKTDSLVEDKGKLTPEQVSAIDEVKREYEAKWAEQEIVLQQRIAMRSPDEVAHSAWFMLHLARSPVWLLGILATLVGFVFHSAALGEGRLVEIQPVLALTLVFALPLGVWISAQTITRRDVVASTVITLGLAAFMILSEPADGRENAPNEAWLVAGLATLALSTLLTAGGLHRRPAVKAALLGTAAGVLFGLHAALIKASVDQLSEGVLAPFENWQLYAVIVLALVSMTIGQISLQAGVLPPAISAQSIVTPLVGVVLGVTLFQERLHEDPLGVAGSLAALLVIFAGIVVLALREGAVATDSRPPPAPQS